MLMSDNSKILIATALIGALGAIGAAVVNVFPQLLNEISVKKASSDPIASDNKRVISPSKTEAVNLLSEEVALNIEDNKFFQKSSLAELSGIWKEFSLNNYFGDAEIIQDGKYLEIKNFSGNYTDGELDQKAI